MGGDGVRRFEAEAKYSSEQARTVAFREEEARFVVVEEKVLSMSAGVGRGVIFLSERVAVDGMTGISIFIYFYFILF